MDIVYQEKEIIYVIEDTNNTLKELKQSWRNAENKYKESLTNGSSASTQANRKSAMDAAYDIYVTTLNQYLQREMGEIKYAI